MIYQANNRQFGALEGLAHWCAEYYYTLERFGADDAEMPAIRNDMSFCMDRCDALGVPYWAQNAALAWAENWRATKAEYFDTAMAKRGDHLQRGRGLIIARSYCNSAGYCVKYSCRGCFICWLFCSC